MYVRASGTNISPCADTFSRQAWKRKRSGEGGGKLRLLRHISLLQDGQNTDREKTEGNKPPSDQMTRTRPTRSTRADRPRHRGMHDTCASCCNMHGQKTYIKTTCCFSYLTPTAQHFFLRQLQNIPETKGACTSTRAGRGVPASHLSRTFTWR